MHDFLTQAGGAERVVLQLAKLYPDAPIFTSLYEPAGTFTEFRQFDVRTSELQGRVDPMEFRKSLFRYANAFTGFDLSDFDVAIVSSSAFAHHVRHTHKLVYCHTPPRFLFTLGSYGLSTSRLQLRDRALRAALSPLRGPDRTAARSAAGYRANSRTTAGRIAQAYGITAGVSYPPLRTEHLPKDVTQLPIRPSALVVSRLLPYKNVDVAIRACARVDIPLTVVGTGPAEQALQAVARKVGASVHFSGQVSDAQLPEILQSHAVILVPGVEDFGYLPLEANYAGRPVVASAQGGSLETITAGHNGLLAKPRDIDAWVQALNVALDRTWDPAALRQSTARFSTEAFRVSFSNWVDSGLLAC